MSTELNLTLVTNMRDCKSSVRVKAETEDPELVSGAKVERPKLRRNHFTYDDLPVNRFSFRKIFLPTYFEFLMSLKDTFNLHNEAVIPGMQKIYNKLYPLIPYQITDDCPLKVLVSGT